MVYDSTHVFDGDTGQPADLVFVGGNGLDRAGDALTLDLPRGGQGAPGRPGFLPVELTFGWAWSGDKPAIWLDVHHLFYDDAAIWSPDGANLMRRPLQGFVVRVYPCDVNCQGTINEDAVTVISSQVSIALSDTFVGYEMVTVDQSGLPAPNFMPAFAGDGTASGLDGKPAEGRSEDFVYVDADQNGTLDGNKGFYSFGGAPYIANLYLRLSLLACDADIDSSGFVDTEDFDAFIVAFEAGC